MNKSLTLIAERCPSAGNDLLSARVGLKHYLGEGGEGKDAAKFKKWKLLQPVAEGLLDECLQGWNKHSEILGDATRWSKPLTIAGLLDDSTLGKAMERLVPGTKKDAAHIWGACYNMLHTKHMAAMSDSTHAYMWDYVLVFGCVDPERRPGERTLSLSNLLLCFQQRKKLGAGVGRQVKFKP